MLSLRCFFLKLFTLKLIAMIKLIVNYHIQVWNGEKYYNQNQSLILTFETIEEISNQKIEEILHEKHRYAFTIESISQIK